MIFAMQGVNPNANIRKFQCDFYLKHCNTAARFCSVIRRRSNAMCNTTQRQRRKADAILNSSAQLIRRRDIARYSGSTAAACA